MEKFTGGFKEKMEQGGRLEYFFALIAMSMIIPVVIIYLIITKLIILPFNWIKKKIWK